MTKIVEINVDTAIARKMLGVAGYNYEQLMSKTDAEIFEMALSMCSCYGVVYKIEEENQ